MASPLVAGVRSADAHISALQARKRPPMARSQLPRGWRHSAGAAEEHHLRPLRRGSRRRPGAGRPCRESKLAGGLRKRDSDGSEGGHPGRPDRRQARRPERCHPPSARRSPDRNVSWAGFARLQGLVPPAAFGTPAVGLQPSGPGLDIARRPWRRRSARRRSGRAAARRRFAAGSGSGSRLDPGSGLDLATDLDPGVRLDARADVDRRRTVLRPRQCLGPRKALRVVAREPVRGKALALRPRSDADRHPGSAERARSARRTRNVVPWP